MKKMIYVLSLLMSLLIAPSFAADKLTVTPTEARIEPSKSKTFSEQILGIVPDLAPLTSYKTRIFRKTSC